MSADTGVPGTIVDATAHNGHTALVGFWTIG